MFSKSTIKFIQSLRQKKNRDKLGLFFAEGPKLVNELLAEGNFICRAIYSVSNNSEQWMNPDLMERYSDRIVEIKDFDLEKIAVLSKPNRVLAIFEQRKANTAPDLKQKLSLVLDDIQDPGNLGTIIRIADWFGIENIFCSLHAADQYNPKVVQSTMASLGRVNVCYVDLKLWLPKISVKKYAATLQGTSIRKMEQLQEGLLLIGNESHGLSESVLSFVDETIRIPRIGQAESLNAAVATGILLYHLKGE